MGLIKENDNFLMRVLIIEFQSILILDDETDVHKFDSFLLLGQLRNRNEFFVDKFLVPD